MNRERLEQILKSFDADGANPSPVGFAPPSVGYSIQIFEELASTNQTLWEAIAGVAEPALWVAIAKRQTAGKGQWGRQWHSPAGGLYLSIALTPNLPVADALLLTLCSAWGIATTLRAYQIPVCLKWPNDLLLHSRKLGGILTETKINRGKITQAVVGVGINWKNPVPETGINLERFGAHRPNPEINSLEMLAALTLHGITSGYQTFIEKGVETLLPSYRQLMVGLGQSVTVKGSPGAIAGVSKTGELLVRLERSARGHENAAPGASPSEIALPPGTISLGYPPPDDA